MPVTAKLSRKFYDALGDEIANELVDWYNAVDLTYRTDLARTVEEQTSRFDERLERRLAEYDARLARRFVEVDRRFAAVDRRFDKIEMQLRRLDDCVTKAEADRQFAEQKAELIKWMFLFWVGSFATSLAANMLIRPF